MPTASLLYSVAMVLTISVTAFLSLCLYVGVQRLDNSRGELSASAAVAALAVWLAATAVMALSGMFSDGYVFPKLFVVFGPPIFTTLAILSAFALLPPLRQRIGQIPLPILIGLQSFRILMELAL